MVQIEELRRLAAAARPALTWISVVEANHPRLFKRAAAAIPLSFLVPAKMSQLSAKSDGKTESTRRGKTSMSAGKRNRLVGVALGLAAAIGYVGYALPPMTQSLAYHNFADGRTLWGVPNFWNVMTNVPFALVGVRGLVFLFQHGDKPFLFFSASHRSLRRGMRSGWQQIYVGVGMVGLILTALGSGCAAPNYAVPAPGLTLAGTNTRFITRTWRLWCCNTLECVARAGETRPS